jgi:hypothetical protein
MKTIKINSQYLSINNPNTKVVAIKSAKGSGKTHWLKANFADQPALFISHRVALVGDIAKRNGASHYQEGSVAYKNSRLVITLDSLPALFYNDIHQGATVIIDESSQVLRHLIGDTLRGKRKQVIDTLNRKLYHAKQVILLDADLDPLTLEYFCHLTGVDPNSDDVSWVENTFNPKDKTFIEYPTAEALQVQLLADLKAGLKCFVASDSKGRVKDLEAFLASKGVDQLLPIHGDNSSQATQSAFISNVNEEQLKYQAVICSPSVSTGVDVNQPHFDKVYLFANGANSTSKDLLQAVARVRTIKEVNFWVDSKKKFEETDWQKILKAKEIAAFGQGFLNRVSNEVVSRKEAGEDYWAFEYDPIADKPVVSRTEFMTMYCKLAASANKDLNDLHSAFIEAAKREGKVIQVKLSDTHEKLSKAVKEESSALRKQRKANEKQAILNAPELTPEEYFVMKEVPSSLSPQEANSVKKYKLTNVLLNGLSEHLEWAVDNEKTAFTSISLMELLSKSDKVIAKTDNKWYINNLGYEPKVKNRTKTKALVLEFLNIIGYYESIETGSALREYGKDPSTPFSAFSHWALQNKNDIKEFLGISVSKDVVEKPFQTIQAILSVLGLGAESKRKRVKRSDVYLFNPINKSYQSVESYNIGALKPLNPDENVRAYFYYADKEAHQRMMAILEAKQAKEAELEKELLPF